MNLALCAGFRVLDIQTNIVRKYGQGLEMDFVVNADDLTANAAYISVTIK